MQLYTLSNYLHYFTSRVTSNVEEWDPLMCVGLRAKLSVENCLGAFIYFQNADELLGDVFFNYFPKKYVLSYL